MRILSTFTFFATVVFAMGGPNDPIADNELGLIAMDCAKQYCRSNDGLALWLTLEQKCTMEYTSTSNFLEKMQQEETVKWSPFVVGSICAVIGIVGTMVGFSTGSKSVRSRKSSYPKSDPPK